MKIYSVSEIIPKAVDCFDDSQEFLTGGRFEAALNRSYYCMFHCIQALLHSKNIVTKSHKGAHSAFHKEFILSQLFPKDLGIMLKATFEKRQFSDYDYEEVASDDAEKSVTDAQRFLNATILYLKQNNFLK